MFGYCKNSMRRFYLPLLLFTLCFAACKNDEPKDSPVNTRQGYMGLFPEAKYVGMSTCATCHKEIYDSFLRTGMGQSFKVAQMGKSVADFSKSDVTDATTGYEYHAQWMRDSLFVTEKLAPNHQLTKQVNFIVGSGQHTNSHMWSQNGYLYQVPMTFYSQKKKWDLPPGFEGGNNTRFDRKIGLECMACHNAYPDFIMGSENKYKSVPQGINCERCHGPGSYHVKLRSETAPVDTAKEIDYSIVNPAKLPVERQFDICQRCHLQGNTVLKPNRSFFDFKPGDTLSNYLSVFVPRYADDATFIMASHAERLKMSKCFNASLKNIQNDHSLKPYKNALTCVTCHNPHKSVRETNANVFNEACQKCHNSNQSLAKQHAPGTKLINCVGCHMPASGSIDIPHVSVHDHYIRVPVKKELKEGIKRFKGLFAVNEKQPANEIKAQAYLNQYEKFESDPMYLDSAAYFIAHSDYTKRVAIEIRYHFIKKDFNALVNFVQRFGVDSLIGQFKNKSFDNHDAWVLYRAGEAFYAIGNFVLAEKLYAAATQLAPFNMEFKNKLGSALAMRGKKEQAVNLYEEILTEQPWFVPAYTSLGYLRMLQGNSTEAIRLYLNGLKYDPRNIQLLTNIAGYYLYTNNKTEAAVWLRKILAVDPKNQLAMQAIKSIALQ